MSISEVFIHGFTIDRDSTLSVDYVVTGLLFLLLVMYDVVGALLGARRSRRLDGFGPALSSLLVTFVIIVSVRWLDLR